MKYEIWVFKSKKGKRMSGQKKKQIQKQEESIICLEK